MDRCDKRLDIRRIQETRADGKTGKKTSEEVGD